MYQLISKRLNQKRKGFTLIELVVVIAILGLLAAIAIPRLGESREAAKKSAHDANVRTLKSAAAMYIAESPNVANGADLSTAVLKYLDGGKLPTNPTLSGPYTVKLDGSGNIYVLPEAGDYTN